MMTDDIDVSLADISCCSSSSISCCSNSSNSTRSQRPRRRRSNSCSSPSSSIVACNYEQKTLLRPWLMAMADQRLIEGLEWVDPVKRTHLKIPWRHKSRSEWSEAIDSKLFKAWAEHKGKCNANESNPRSQKRNFRCALSSLKDGRFVTDDSVKNGPNAYVVYEFLPEIPKKRDHRTTITRSNSVKIDNHVTEHSSVPGRCDDSKNYGLSNFSVDHDQLSVVSSSSSTCFLSVVKAVSGSTKAEHQFEKTQSHRGASFYRQSSDSGSRLPTYKSIYGTYASTPPEFQTVVGLPATSMDSLWLTSNSAAQYALTSGNTSLLPTSQQFPVSNSIIPSKSGVAGDTPFREDFLLDIDSLLENERMKTSTNVVLDMDTMTM